MKILGTTLRAFSIVAAVALTSSWAAAQTTPVEPAKIVKLKSRCAADTRLLQMAIGNKAREAMATAGWTKVVVSVAIKPIKETLTDVTAANVQGLSGVTLADAAQPKFTVAGGPLDVSCSTEVNYTIRASGVKGTAKRTNAVTEGKIAVKGVYR